MCTRGSNAHNPGLSLLSLLNALRRTISVCSSRKYMIIFLLAEVCNSLQFYIQLLLLSKTKKREETNKQKHLINTNIAFQLFESFTKSTYYAENKQDKTEEHKIVNIEKVQFCKNKNQIMKEKIQCLFQMLIAQTGNTDTSEQAVKLMFFLSLVVVLKKKKKAKIFFQNGKSCIY